MNNAGFGLIGEAAELDRAEQLAMIDLNIRVLTELSLAFVDALGRLRGGILNVASVAGFLPGPGMAVYYATKAYVLSFSEALNHEIKSHGRARHRAVPGPGADRVPGPRRHPGSGTRERPARATRPRLELLSRTAEVAAAGYAGLMRGQRVVIPGIGNKAVSVLISPRIPRRGLLLNRRRLLSERARAACRRLAAAA